MNRGIDFPAGALRMPARALLMALACAAALPMPARALNIVATYDTSITNHPQASTIMATINAAIAQFPARIVDPVTVTITFQRMYSGLGASSTNSQAVLYSDLLAALRNHASSLDDAVALSHVPNGPGNPVNGNDTLGVFNPLLRALALGGVPQTGPAGAGQTVSISILNPMEGDPEATPAVREQVRRLLLRSITAPSAVPAGPDGTILLDLDKMNLTTNPTPAGKYGLFAVASHEIDEVLGSASALNNLNNGTPAPTGPIRVEDLFRYNYSGARNFNTSTTDSSFLSLDGVNRLVRFNQTQGGDYSDWWSPAGNIPRVQDAFQTAGVDPAMGVEWRMVDVLGWSYAPIGTWVDMGYGGTQTGAYDTPYSTLSGGIAAAATGAVIFIKAGTNSTQLLTFTKPLTFTTVGGAVTIGQ
jgi:hypothetical protein